MNTRRKVMQPKPEVRPANWKLMEEPFCLLFEACTRHQVEHWYNVVADESQRAQFLAMCRGMHEQDPSVPDPTYRAAITGHVEKEEAHLLLRHYGGALSDDAGKPKARAWLLHRGTSARDRDNFRSFFTGCLYSSVPQSVMHADYTPPEAESYATDRTFFMRSVDGNKKKNQGEMQTLAGRRRGVRSATTPTEADQRSIRDGGEVSTAPMAKPRFTKPKSQFDGVNVLSSLGYEGVPQEQAVAELTAKRDANRDAQWYYVDKDGSTVYKAKGSKGQNHGPAAVPAGAGSGGGGGLLTSVINEPMTRWVNKVCE